ncbi:tyrosine-protein kinase family protein [Ancylobacter radicis]|uniref:Lipopolysaccharide biosynthesis protein n=1 Tax=Ancylobacter radicis TaxID=2836179 RepID=A0ABS5R468_9HYPH|nr:lipopolysaccharide biosynthesis protein [Ancylobacter radicis]MBS9476460.1 lipopolysaccharide biosynthesis protein [Ancylobacter radicis]
MAPNGPMVDEPDIAREMAPAEGAESAAMPGAAPIATAEAAPGRHRLRRSWHLYRRHLLVPSLLAVLAGSLVGLAVEPRYAAEARLLPEARGMAAAATRAQIISSREFARQVLDDSRLAERLAGRSLTLTDRLNALLGAPATASTGDLAALRAVEGGLSVSDRADGQTTIRFVAPHPALAAEVANAFADGYLRLRQARGAFNMESGGPIAMPARLAVRAQAPAEALAPAPALAAGGAALGVFGFAFGLQMFRRRRRSNPPAPPATVPQLPELAREGAAQHLPWIGGESVDYAEEGDLLPRRHLSREGELADLSRMVELRGDAARLVVVTGPSTDEGIARCALALARSLAAPERRTVIVCLDVMAPALAELTADPRAPGLTDLLFGVASFSDAIHREAASRCHVIPPGRGACEASGLVGADRLTLILRALMQTYDHVVVAAPPLGTAEGAERIAALKPTLILVTQPGGPATDAVHAFDHLAAQGFGDIAMVTFTEMPAPTPAPLPQAA